MNVTIIALPNGRWGFEGRASDGAEIASRRTYPTYDWAADAASWRANHNGYVARMTREVL